MLYDVKPRTLPIKCGIWAGSTAMALRMHNTNTFMNYSPTWWIETLLNVIRSRKRVLSEISSSGCRWCRIKISSYDFGFGKFFEVK